MKFCIPFLCLITAAAFAQEKIVSGSVTSKEGALSGVSILEKNTSNAAITDDKGNYQITLHTDAVLIYSLSGYTAEEILVTNQITINVILMPEMGVAVGYGISSAKDFTGSSAAIASADFNKGIISTPDQLIQGRFSGVTVTASSGEPGTMTSMDIRGISSIKGNSSPLYIIDGVPFDTGSSTSSIQGGIEGMASYKSPLLFLNPNDIENITVLKDASAVIYGSRAANGVVIITTRHRNAANNKGSFSFNSYVGVSNPQKRFDLLNGPDFLKGVEGTNIAAGVSPSDAALAVAGPPVNNIT
jgi:TonB-dependent starch-binding outer membrane protein SusC